jgi:protein-tyrosine phosphatase/predicted kinase
MLITIILMNKLCFLKGCVMIDCTSKTVSDLIEKICSVPTKDLEEQKKRDSNHYHMTVIDPTEMTPDVTKIAKQYENQIIEYYVLGYGATHGCYYLVCTSPQADIIRKKCGLTEKDFHITIGFDTHDVHDVNKGLNTVVKWNDEWITMCITNPSPYPKKRYAQYQKCYENDDTNPNVIYAYAKSLGDMKEYDLSLLLAESLLSHDEFKWKGLYIMFKIKKCQNIINEKFVKTLVTDLQTLSKVDENKDILQFIKEINQYIILSSEIDEDINVLCYDSEKKKITTGDMPRNFSFVDAKVCGSGKVSQKYLLSLKSIGVTDIINLTEHSEISESDVKEMQRTAQQYGINVHHYPIIDRKATTHERVDEILTIIENAKMTLVHCMGGIGRTNMILASYIMKYKSKLGIIAPAEAVTMLETERKVMVTTDQMMFLKKFYGTLCSVDKTEKKMQSGLMMLVGLPCSGKSTLSLAFVRTYGDSILHINQDELGKSECVKTFSQSAKKNVCLVLDRCNMTKAERKEWIDMYTGVTNKNMVCIAFNYPVETCLDRVKLRQHHPTLSGPGGMKIIQDMAPKFEMPNSSEGFKEIITVSNDDELDALYKRFGLKQERKPFDDGIIIKFPRTKHLANLGAASRDDLIFDKKELDDFLKCSLLIEEKVDGANLGIFKDNGGMYRVQNRSHFVDSKYHAQFKPLNAWLDRHQTDLDHIVSERNYILYGEWVCLKHSIHYTNLPDYFLLYDIYDRDTNSFLARKKVEDIISETSISMVPIIYEGMATLEELKKMVFTQSKFYDGHVEGIYVRAFDGNKLKYRGKIVRSNFICGDDHWTKGGYTSNIVKTH